MTVPHEILSQIADRQKTIDAFEETRRQLVGPTNDYIDGLVNPLKADVATLREQLLPLMVEHGSKTIDGYGYRAQDVASTEWVITDETAAYNALSVIGRLDECVKLDKKAVEKVAKSEDLDGVESRVKHTLRILLLG